MITLLAYSSDNRQICSLTFNPRDKVQRQHEINFRVACNRANLRIVNQNILLENAGLL